jgi:plasmid stabilization system protein ParE
VRTPRHIVVYRWAGNVLVVLRVLNDAMDLERHVTDNDGESQ